MARRRPPPDDAALVGGERLTLALLAATALAIVAVGVLAIRGARPSTVASALALSFVPYAAAAVRPLPTRLERGLLAPMIAAGLVGLGLLFAPPVLSDDVFRYAWDGHVLRAGVDPYAFAPADPALAPLRDDVFRQVNHPDIPTIYPPIAIALFAFFGALAGGVLPMKLLALLGHLACIPVVGALAPPDERARARWLFALHPLALVETALAGHVDAFAGLGIALAVFALGRERPGRAALGALVAVGTKLVGLLLVPLLAARSRRAAFACAVAGAILVAPLLLAGRGSGVPGGLSEYAQRWQGNAALFALVEGGVEHALEAIAGPGRQTVRLGPLARLPGLADARPKKAVDDPDRVSIARVAGLVSRALLGAVVLVAALALARRSLPVVVAARLTVLVALLCAPQVHPWYLLWLLPLELACGGIAGQVWAAAIVVAYAPLDRWIVAREWVEPPFALAAQLAAITLALGFEWRRRADS